MKEREDLLKTKELCEKILKKDPTSVVMLAKLEAVKKKLRLIERRITDHSEPVHKPETKKKDSFSTGYL